MLPSTLEETIARRLMDYGKRLSHLERLEGGGGAWNLIEEIELLVDGPTIDFNNIPDNFRHLYVKFMVRGARAASIFDETNMRLNGDSGANYSSFTAQWYHNNQYITAEFLAQTSFISWITIPATTAPANDFLGGWMFFPYYSNTTFNKKAMNYTNLRFGAAAGQILNRQGMGTWISTAAINRIEWYSRFANDLLAGSIASLYGIA